ncbi:MAG: penicillin-binding protein, partial [bacterium]|nr:penicillin-binding protein [bacterium]
LAAMEAGWRPDDRMTDSPVAVGKWQPRNYGGRYYGDVTLREGFARSLNSVSVRLTEQVGRERVAEVARRLGITSDLEVAPSLALGASEVTLLELVQAYATLAREGVHQPLSAILDRHDEYNPTHRIYSAQVSSLIADILSDPEARRLEFGRSHLLNLPVQTAVKTGTSNDYRDAWALGFSSRHTVGVWMGNLDQTTMKKVSGSVGPALVL